MEEDNFEFSAYYSDPILPKVLIEGLDGFQLDSKILEFKDLISRAFTNVFNIEFIDQVIY